MVKDLCEAGVTIKQAADNGVSPILTTAHQGHGEVVKVLYEEGWEASR